MFHLAVYTTEQKCRDFNVLISECMRDSALASVHEACYLAVLMDGSSNSSVVDKELIYVMFIGSNGTA